MHVLQLIRGDGQRGTWQSYTYRLLDSGATATEDRSRRVIQYGQRMSGNCYIRVGIIMIKKNRDGKSTLNPMEHTEQPREGFPLLPGNLGRGRIVALVEV